MTQPRLLAVLTVANLVLLTLLLAHGASAEARGDAAVLRGRALEIVDERGKVRASIKVQPAGRTPDGTPYPDTAILRLIDPNGRPEVKLAASDRGAGLSLLGAADETHVIIDAEGAVTSLRLVNGEGRQQVLTP